jgi:ribosome-associated protein
MEPKELALLLAEALADRKAEDIVILEVEALVSYTSYILIAGGRSDRQVQAVAGHLERAARDAGVRPVGTEGTDGGCWALLDYGDCVVHVFRNQERDFYDLEALWSDAPRVPFDPVPEEHRAQQPGL